MSRQEGHPASLQGTRHDCVRGIAKGRLYPNLAGIGKSWHGVETASPQNPNARLFLPAFVLFLFRSSRHFHLSFVLLIDRHRFGFPFSVALTQIRRRHIRIVSEKCNPSFFDRLRNPFLFVFERSNRIQVESHDPRKRQVSRSWHKIREEKRSLTAAAA